MQKTLNNIWNSLYGKSQISKLRDFFTELDSYKKRVDFEPHEPGWYKDAVVYSTYVDLYNNDFNGLADKLEYLRDLGINCIWLLPILDSPMRDAGFDIRDYRKIRDELTGLPLSATENDKSAVFDSFLHKAHSLKIKVIFDIAMNHTSDQHEWFLQSRSSADNPYRNYYIWNKDTNLYKETRLLFKGMCPSNWERDCDFYYFHRFFEFQPDLNYKNPDVLIEMCRNLVYWLGKGVDGFRADAIPYIWKEDGTNCENLPGTHLVVKFFRAVLDYIRPDTLLLAEACQPPLEVVKYFGDGDECHAGYHFPLMPQIFKALAIEKAEPIVGVLQPAVTPSIEASNQWFLFLRLHDELTLEMVTPEDRKIIYDYYCRDPRWDFRVGEGISARLADLLSFNPDRIALAYSIMFTLPGTPVIYYGDEFGKMNDEKFYEEMINLTGKNDTRFFVRGRMDWEQVKNDLANHASFAYKVNSRLRNMLAVRNEHKSFGRGSLEWMMLLKKDGTTADEVLSYKRSFGSESILVIQNLAHYSIHLGIPELKNGVEFENLLESGSSQKIVGGIVLLEPFSFGWFCIR